MVHVLTPEQIRTYSSLGSLTRVVVGDLEPGELPRFVFVFDPDNELLNVHPVDLQAKRDIAFYIPYRAGEVLYDPPLWGEGHILLLKHLLAEIFGKGQ